MAGPDSSHGVSRVVHHKDFYLRGGDMTLLVENHLYRIHSYFFDRESLFFRQKFSDANNNGNERGLTDADAYTLEGVKSEDFARFLWVFYNPKYSVYEAPLETWLSIIHLANRWTFDNVKELAVRELEKITIEAVEKIYIYHENNISRLYLIPSYISVCKRDKPLSFTEGMKLGMETVLRIAEARERMRLQASESGIRSPTFDDFEDTEVETLIREIFQLGPRPSPCSAAPVTNGVNGAANSVLKLNPAPPGKTNGASGSRGNGGSAADPKRSSVDSMPSIASITQPQALAMGTRKTEAPLTGTPLTGTPPTALQGQQAQAPSATTPEASTPQSQAPDKPPKDKETVPGSATSLKSPKPAGGAGEPSSSVESSAGSLSDVSITKPVVLSGEHDNSVTPKPNDNVNNGKKDDLAKDNDTASVASDTEGGRGGKSAKRGNRKGRGGNGN